MERSFDLRVLLAVTTEEVNYGTEKEGVYELLRFVYNDDRYDEDTIWDKLPELFDHIIDCHPALNDAIYDEELEVDFEDWVSSQMLIYGEDLTIPSTGREIEIELTEEAPKLTQDMFMFVPNAKNTDINSVIAEFVRLNDVETDILEDSTLFAIICNAVYKEEMDQPVSSLEAHLKEDVDIDAVEYADFIVNDCKYFGESLPFPRLTDLTMEELFVFVANGESILEPEVKKQAVKL